MKRSSGSESCSDLSTYPGCSKQYKVDGDDHSHINPSSFIRFQRSRERRSHLCKPGKSCCPKSLSDLSAQIAAASIPFELVEERYPRVPEPVLRKLITWSFPRHEEDIRRYSSIDELPNDSATGFSTFLGNRLSHSNARDRNDAEQSDYGGLPGDEDDGQETTFHKGVTLAEDGKVLNAMQIGFHLSAVIRDPFVLPEDNVATFNTVRSYNVSVTFDRCKVTSSACNCGKGVFFCRHVVALLIHRMRHPSRVEIRTPISDSLCELKREQLQKLTQYLLARYPHILPTAQELIDEFCDPDSTINLVRGAPDPTAGAGYHDDDRWSMNDEHVTNHTRNLVSRSNERASVVQLHCMLKKVREMMKARDSNGARLLSIITEELLKNGNLSGLPTQSSTSLWDEIALLWICVVLNPSEGKKKKQKILQQLRMWSDNPQCPPVIIGSSNSNLHRKNKSVLCHAVNAGSLTWDDQHLKNILRKVNDKELFSRSEAAKNNRSSGGFANFNVYGQPLWHEHAPTACARVEALRAYGYEIEAVRLATAVARTIREKAVGELYLQRNTDDGKAGLSGRVKNDRNLGLGLIGHPLNPIRTLIDALTSPHDKKIDKKLKQEDGCTRNALKREAVEVCLLAFGEQRCMPRHSASQKKTLWCEKELIDHVTKMQFDDELIRSLRNIANLLLEGGHRSGLGKRVHRESFPNHLFAKFLFNSLLLHDKDLAFKVGLRAMRMSILDAADELRCHDNNRSYCVDDQAQVTPPRLPRDDNQEELDTSDGIRGTFYSYPTSWAVMDDLEDYQYDLASTMLQSAKGEVMLLRRIVESIQKHVRNTSKMYQLSQDAYKFASSHLTTSLDSTMLNVAMELAMQVLRMTMAGRRTESWQRNEMVGWLVTCATEIGLCALISIIKSWFTLFTPVEACTIVAGCVISANTAMRLNLDPRQREELYQNVCHMAVQCAVKDPQSCGLCSLTLSETYSAAFDNVYHVIVDAANKRQIDSTQLFTTARYMDQRGLHKQAFVIAYLATRRISAPFNYDAHPSANDLLWTAQLAQSLGMKELEDLILVIISKVRCATVLSDILRTCTSPVSGRLPTFIGTFPNRDLRADHPPLRPLLDASMKAYVNSIHNKLGHISPRHYTEFIEFLNKARETFLLAPDGLSQFSHLLDNLKMIYKGKKKLLTLVTLRFG